MKFAREVLEAFNKLDSKGLRNLSDAIMVDGFIDKNKELIKLAVVSHSLSRVSEKDYYRKDQKFWEVFVKDVRNSLEKIANDEEKVEPLEKAIINLDEHFGRYKDSLLHYSRIRKGSTLYAWGMGISLASKMVDVNERELMKQVGRTKIVDEEELGKPISSRMKDAEELL